MSAGKKSSGVKQQNESPLFPKREQAHRAFWDIAAGLSLIVNVVLVAAVIILAGQLRNIKTTMNGLLGGLYGNFSEMDNASITTTITLDTQIPLDFMLPIQQNTDVVLTDSISIPRAHVVINSGGFTINAPANVTLPAGTNLPIALNIAVPVQFTVPLTLQIPLNIPLAQTGLHQPLAGLQDIVRSYYCTLDKNAQNPQKLYICAGYEISTPTPGVP